MYKNIIVILFILICTDLQAQNDADALRYSMLSYGSTARSLGMGNSFGALGADISTMSTNPAGIAMYRRSEITFSPLFSDRYTSGEYRGLTNTDDYFKLAFGNFGIVLSIPKEDKYSAIKNWTFAFGYNKLSDFNSRTIASGNNANHSLLDNWLYQLDGVAPDQIANNYPYDVNLAWQTYLIDTVTIDSQLYYFNALPYAGTNQTRTTTTKGNMGEWDFSAGANIDNNLFLGLTLGFTTLRYREKSVWQEYDAADTIPYFTSFSYTQNLNTTGTGVNVKFGVIYKPADFIRLGAAIHTPTWMTLTDNYDASISADLQDGQIRNYSGPAYLPYQYSINTPFSALGSLGLIISKTAAINFDYEYLDYGLMRLRSSDLYNQGYFNDVNSAIKSKYTEQHNIRAGVEIRNNIFRYRAGGFYSTSPFKKDQGLDMNTDQSRYGITAGFGLRMDHFFVDFAYSYSRTGYFYQPYTLSYANVPGMSYKQIDNRFLTTIGFNF